MRQTEYARAVSARDGDRRKRADVVVFALVVVLVTALMVGAVAARRGSEVAGSGVRTIRMAGDSEYFTDPDVLRELKRNGFRVEQNRKGSRGIADLPDLATAYDVALAGSDNAAQHIIAVLRDKHQVEASSLSPFSSPMVVITHQRIVALLEKIGMVHRSGNGTWVFEVSAYLDPIKQKRWNEIPNTDYNSANRIRISTTDPTQSNSGGMLMAIETFVANGNSVVSDVDAFLKANPGSAKLIRSTFTDLGSKLPHTPDLLALFLRDGPGRYPMGLFYEKDYINTKLHQANTLDEVVLMYPNPTVTSDNTFVWWGQDGRDFANLLITDPTLIELAEKHGYHALRPPAQFVKDMANKGVTVADLSDPGTQVTVASLPTEENLFKLTEELGK